MADKTAIIKEAQKHLARGQVDKAIAEWEKLIRESPDGNTYNMVGDLYLKKGDKKNAIESYHKAAGYFRQEGFSLKALALYKKVLNINQSDSAALYALGELSEEKGLATDAIKYYLAAADGLSKEGKKDQLLEIYQKILSLSPSNIPLRNKVAEIFLKEGLKTDAAKEYQHIAKAYEEKGDITKAREYYEKIAETQPLSKEAAIGISRLYQKSGDIGNAVSKIREAAERSPYDTDILFRYAELSLAAKDFETSEGCLRKILEVNAADMKAKGLLAELFMKEGDEEKAWEEYIPVIDDMILQGGYDEPVRLLEMFRRVDPLETGRRLVSLHRQKGELGSLSAELGALGDALKDRGKKDDALGCYREALEVNPADVRIRELIEELERKPAEEEVPQPSQEAGTGEEEAGITTAEGEKTEEEILTEADIFSRYGLVNEAIKVLEQLKLRNPQSADIHTRLKTLYTETSDRESAVTECLILNELFKRNGDAELAEKMLHEAAEISPEDPRLAERGITPQETPQETPQGTPQDEHDFILEHTSYGSGQPGSKQTGAADAEGEDYEEEIAEADFYVRQGLVQEAAKILERLHTQFPENTEVAERLAELGQFSEREEVAETQSPLDDGVSQQEEPTKADFGIRTDAFEMPAGEIEIPEELKTEAPPEEESRPPEEIPSEQPPAEGGFEEFNFSEEDLVDAQEMPEPELDSDVLEIFQEFKKGLEKELGEEDSETHYNLGIAYKEMGLVDDAITEFQASRGDPMRFMQSSTMLALCYMEKGMYSLVIDVLGKVLEQITEKDESYRAVQYDLAEAHEKNNNPVEALRLYTEVFGWNAKFRSVADKVTQLRDKGPGGEKPKTRKDRVSYL
jgi:tetratricopeptide (TPR) repeat protein